MTDPVSAAAMISASVLVPALMVFVGYVFMNNPPETDSRFAYRTERSMAGPEAWESAHRALGGIMVRMGTAVAAICAAVMCIAMFVLPAQVIIVCLALVGLGIASAVVAFLLAGRAPDV